MKSDIGQAEDTLLEDERLTALMTRALNQFEKTYGRRADRVAVGPGRVNLIGEHVDYNDGFVLPMAIERSVVIAGGVNGASEGKTVRVATELEPSVVSIDVASPVLRGKPDWSNYVRGVLAGFQRLGAALPALDLMIVSDLPAGGGLSSSAALEVATATLLETATGITLSPAEKALLCQQAEHEFAGVPCGIMDQFASTMSRRDHLLLLDCRSQQVEHVPMTDDSVSVLIINSNVRHALTDGGYALRRRQCEEAARLLDIRSLRDADVLMLNEASSRMEPVIFRRAMHVIGEIKRTRTTAESISAGDWATVGRCMAASHASLRDDFEVSCRELDVLVELAASVNAGESGEDMRGGVIGCRMTGGGFGGCVVCLVKSDQAEAIADAITQRYQQATGIEASHFVTRPAQGARMLRIRT